MKNKLASAAIAIILSACAAHSAAAAACTVYVRGIVGVVEVFVKSDTDWDDAELDQCLQIGDKIRTGADGHVNLDFTSRADVSLNALTQFQISSSDTKSEVADQGVLTAGGAWAGVRKSGTKSASFSIKTPTAVAGVRGTEFDVEVDEAGDSDINVEDGEVDISNEFGESKARAGDGVRVRRGNRPDHPRKFDVKERKKKLGLWKDKIKKGKDLRNENQRKHRDRRKNRDADIGKDKEAPPVKDKPKNDKPDKKPRGGPRGGKR